MLALIPTRAELSVSLLSIDPGPEVYQLEGHTELHFSDPEIGLDSTVSWGVFDFNSPGFLYRFVKGETDYLAVSYPYSYFLASNAMAGRKVTSLKLNLTQEEAHRLLDLVNTNLLPQNRVYRYNYVKDNCATRPLHLIEEALGTSLVFPVSTSTSPSTSVSTSMSTSTTWRREMSRYHAAYPWYQFGIDLALGSGIDIPIDGYGLCYAPANLRDILPSITRSDNGQSIVTGAESVILAGDPDGQPLSPTPWYLTPFFVAWVVLVIVVITAVHDIRVHRQSRFIPILLGSIGFIAGMVLTYLIFFSTHEATAPNWNYLWLNPLCIITAISPWLKKHNRMVLCYQIVNFVALVALIIIGITGVQVLNTAFYPLIASYMIVAAEYIYLNTKNQNSPQS